jgi:hypothetical protein
VVRVPAGRGLLGRQVADEETLADGQPLAVDDGTWARAQQPATQPPEGGQDQHGLPAPVSAKQSPS